MAQRDRPTVDEARVQIAYHRRVLIESRSLDRRLRAERAIARLQRVLLDETRTAPRGAGRQQEG